MLGADIDLDQQRPASGWHPFSNASSSRNFQIREDIQGYYRPSDTALEGSAFGAWVDGLFGLLMGFGLFALPVAGLGGTNRSRQSLARYQLPSCARHNLHRGFPTPCLDIAAIDSCRSRCIDQGYDD